MRLRSMALAGATLLVLCGPAAAGQGWYIGAEAGWSMPNDIKWKFPEFPGNTGRINSDDSLLFGGTVGFKIPDGLRIEFEASHVSYNINTISVNGTVYPADGDTAQTVLFGNLIYDLPIANRWAIALGGGIGGGWVTPDISVATGPTSLQETEAAFAWQLLAGVVYSITPQLDFQIDYRFRSVDTTDHVWDFVPACCATPMRRGEQEQPVGDDRHPLFLPADTTADDSGARCVAATAATAATASAAAGISATAAAASPTTASAASTTTGGFDIHRVLRLRPFRTDAAGAADRRSGGDDGEKHRGRARCGHGPHRYGRFADL